MAFETAQKAFYALKDAFEMAQKAFEMAWKAFCALKDAFQMVSNGC